MKTILLRVLFAGIAAALCSLAPSRASAGMVCADLDGDGVYGPGECIDVESDDITLRGSAPSAEQRLQEAQEEVARAQKASSEAQMSMDKALKQLRDPKATAAAKDEAGRQAKRAQLNAQKAQLTASVAQARAQKALDQMLKSAAPAAKADNAAPKSAKSTEMDQDIATRSSEYCNSLTCYDYGNRVYCCPYGYPYLSRCDYQCYSSMPYQGGCWSYLQCY